jgi:hypothetical protein
MQDKKLESYDISKKDMRILIKNEIQDVENEIKQLKKEHIIIDTELKNTKNLAHRKVLIDDEKQILNDIDDLKNQLKGLNQYVLNDKEDTKEKVEITDDDKPSLETYETDEKSIDNEPSLETYEIDEKSTNNNTI